MAREYRLIREETVPVVVPYGPGFELLESFLGSPSLQAFRTLQPYLVNLYHRDLRHTPFAEQVHPGLYRWTGGYDPRRGIVEGYNDPGDLVV